MICRLLLWTIKPFKNRVYSEKKKEFDPYGSNSFLSELTRNKKGGGAETKNAELLSL